MADLPQLTEEDFQLFNQALNALLAKTEANAALIVERAGYLIHQCGQTDSFDATLVATLASNAFNAAEVLAQYISEPHFSGVYQQGDQFSTLMLGVDEHCVLVVIFKASLAAGMIRYYAADSIKQVAAQFQHAHTRAPGVLFDLVDMNAADVGVMFKRKDDPAQPATEG